MGLTQAAVHHEKNDQSRQTVDANKWVSGHYYQSVDSQELDHLNKVNENIENKACDTVGLVGDLAVCDILEKNNAFTSIEQELQDDICASDYNINSDERINADNWQRMCK